MQSLTKPIPTGRIKVLIVDDSALIRRMLSDIINHQPAFEIHSLVSLDRSLL